MKGPTIELERLSYSFGSKRALQDVTLTIPSGSTLGLIGPNGAGKTTLVGCLLGLLGPESGRVSIDGLDPRDERARIGLGQVPERPGFDRSSSARATLQLHHALAGLPVSEREAEVEAALESAGLSEASGARIRSFSKGMLQRLSFAAALLGRPRWLVLDEPFSGVDPAGVARLRELLTEARNRGATIVLNSHRLDQVGRLCDRVALLARGRVERVVDCSADGPGTDATLEGLVLAAAKAGR